MRLLKWHEARVVERGGYACGVVSARLQRVESVRVEKKIDKADIGTFDGHELFSTFMFVDYAKKMKPNVVCHNHWADAIAQFQFHEKIQKDESGRRVRRVAAPNAICKEAA